MVEHKTLTIIGSTQTASGRRSSATKVKPIKDVVRCKWSLLSGLAQMIMIRVTGQMIFQTDHLWSLENGQKVVRKWSCKYDQFVQ